MTSFWRKVDFENLVFTNIWRLAFTAGIRSAVFYEGGRLYYILDVSATYKRSLISVGAILAHSSRNFANFVWENEDCQLELIL